MHSPSCASRLSRVCDARVSLMRFAPRLTCEGGAAAACASLSMAKGQQVEGIDVVMDSLGGKYFRVCSGGGKGKGKGVGKVIV
jgi:hypothetical protein